MRWPGAVATLATLVFASPAHGQLLPRDGSAPIAVRAEHVAAVVEDGLARTTVRQTFVNPGDRPLEAVYLFPVPEDAALIDVAMEVGGERLEGLLAERRRARRVYDDIVRGRRDPALVEQVGRSTFRLSVFPVLPGQETVVELAWIQPVPLTQGAYRYVYPLAAGTGAAAPRELAFTLQVRAAAPIREVTASCDEVHVVRQGPAEVTASLERSGALPDRDLVVTAAVRAAKPSLVVRTYREEGRDGWFLAVVTPPPAREERLVPRDVVLVLDTSGSMGADGKLEQARASALWLLEHLRPADRVNVLRFSSDVQAFAQAPVAATPGNLAQLREFVRGFEAGGSTALGDALLAATDGPAAAPEGPARARTVVLLTDGRPTVGETDRARLVELARAGGARGLRLFPFGVGDDVDSALLLGIAAAGGGRAEVFRPGGEIATRLTSFLARTASPVIADLSLAVEGVEVHDVFPRPLPDAYLGEQVVISGRYRGAGPGTATVSATVGDARRRLTATLDFPASPGGSPTVRHVHARAKLDWLERARRLRLGLADDAYYAALDRGAYSTEGEVVQEMIAVSLEHGVQCAYTSFLVLLEEDRRRLDPRDAEALDAALARVSAETRGALGEPAPPGEATEEEPIIQDFEVRDSGDFEATVGDPDLFSDSPFDARSFNNVIGVGGGAGGKYGGRFGGRRNLRAAGGSGSAVQQDLLGLQWLEAHQDGDGRWDSDGFMRHDPEGGRCDGAGAADADVEVTALALLAFLGDGSTLREGEHRDVVTRGVKWLRQEQDFGSGRLPGPLRGHAIATQVLCETYRSSRSPLIRGTAQKAVGHLVARQRADGSWAEAPDGAQGDLALSAWAAAALEVAREAGLAVEEAAIARAREWLGRSSNAAALATQGPVGDLRYHAVCALGRAGGAPWNDARGALLTDVLASRRTDGPGAGSWDATGPRASIEGRVGATATAVLCLELGLGTSRLVAAGR